MTRLLTIDHSTRADKKYMATFQRDDGKFKVVHFGDKSAQDYTQHKDMKRRAAYRARHKKDLGTRDPTRAGYLSYFLLWGDSTNLADNIRSYRNRFGL